MMPPTSIDGTDITGATIDGTEVQEITVDGQTVFSAGPDIPDSGDLHSHYDASDATTVNPWADLASNNDLSSTGSPTILTNDKNGLNTVIYDGVDDGHTANISSLTEPFHIFIAHQILDTNINSTMLYGDTGLAGKILLDGDTNEGYRLGPGFEDSGYTVNTNWHVGEFLFNGTSSRINIDNDNPATVNSGGAVIDEPEIMINSSQTRFVEGKLGEILVYNENKSNVASDVMNYLSNKWGINLA